MRLTIPRGVAWIRAYVPRIHRNRVDTLREQTYYIAEVHNNHCSRDASAPRERVDNPKMELKQVIERGETQTVEFKQSMSQMKDGCKALCGMLNADQGAGIVLFGISPSSDVIGLQNVNLDSIQRTLVQHIQQKLEPSLTCSIEILDCDGEKIIALSAQRPKNIPYFEYDGRAFIKEGSTKRQLSLQEKQTLLLRRDRAHHNGPWQCDNCGLSVGMLSSIVKTDEGPRRSYDCQCGGEFWPAT